MSDCETCLTCVFHNSFCEDKEGSYRDNGGKGCPHYKKNDCPTCKWRDYSQQGLCETCTRNAFVYDAYERDPDVNE